MKKHQDSKAQESELVIVIPPSSKRHIVLISALLAAATAFCLLIIFWLMANARFTSISVAKVNIAGSISDAQLMKLVANQAGNYRLTLSYPDGKTAAYKLADMGITANPSATVVDLRHTQQNFWQRVTWWRPVTVKLNTTVDTQVMGTFITQHIRAVLQPATNASLRIEGDKVKVSAAADGKQVGLEKPAETLLAAASKMQSKTLQLKPIVLKPEITEAMLAPAKTQAEGILGQHITIAIGTKNVTPSAADIGHWIAITPTKTGADIAVSEDQISSYLKGLAKSNTKSPTNQVISDTTGEVLEAGAKGVTVGSTQGATDALKQGLLAAKGVQTSLPVTYTNFQTVRSPVAGKWFDVDLTNKRMYAYENGQLVRTFLISAGAPATPTPVGRFKIYTKLRSQDMTGSNTDGTTYFQPAVPYVNYFTGGYAIHGNYWRPNSWFGNINSSHGCVGVTVSEGAWIYDWAPVGTTVVTHL